MLWFMQHYRAKVVVKIPTLKQCCTAVHWFHANLPAKVIPLTLAQGELIRSKPGGYGGSRELTLMSS